MHAIGVHQRSQPSRIAPGPAKHPGLTALSPAFGGAEQRARPLAGAARQPDAHGVEDQSAGRRAGGLRQIRVSGGDHVIGELCDGVHASSSNQVCGGGVAGRLAVNSQQVVHPVRS